jgi:hypothetical protein
MVLVLALVVAGVLFFAQVFRSRRPYVIHRSELTGWQVVLGRLGGGVTVGLQPPPSLATDLYEQVTDRAGTQLAAPAQSIVPLVLREEFDTSLMGVLSAEEIVDIARQSGIESASFEPVCMAQHSDDSAGQDERLFFVLFESPEFERARADLMLMHPEHGGAVEFDPKALSPILTVAATDGEFARWWSLLPHDQRDCQIAMRTE